MKLLGLPRGLVQANGVVFVLFTGGLLPLAAHAFAGTDGVVRRAKLRSLNGDALARLARGAKNAPARGAHLCDAVLGENSPHELRALVVIAPPPELLLTQTVDLHAPSTDTSDPKFSRKPKTGHPSRAAVRSSQKQFDLGEPTIRAGLR